MDFNFIPDSVSQFDNVYDVLKERGFIEQSTDEEKVRACELSVKAGADFVKTSTGFSTGGAVVSDVALMKKTVGEKALVKASGGIHTREEMLAMIEAGASRIGASAGMTLIKED